MFYSQGFISNKGPLGAIWVAAYSLKRLNRDQIAQTDILSSVDKILIDEWPSVTYRILAYLLLGVVRVYSKKVEFVLHDCRKFINELHKFVDKKKAISFREIVRPEGFSVTLPERYELDAFVLDLADDMNNAHVAEKEDIILRDSLKIDKFAKWAINKCHGDGTIQQTAISTTTKAISATAKRKAGPSAQNPPESALKMETCSTALAPVEKIVSSSSMEIDAETSSSQFIRSLEASIEELREIRFSREECLDFERFYHNDKEHLGIFESCGIIQGAYIEHEDLIWMMQTEKNGLFHADAENVCHSIEKNPDLEKPSDNHYHVAGEEKEANFTVQSSLCLKMLPNNHNHFSAEEEVNHEHVSATEQVTTTVERIDSKKSHQSDSGSPAPEKEKLLLTVQTTPDLKSSDVKDPTPCSTELLAVRTPANKERVRRASKRKCIYDDSTVISNQTLKDSINDASGLVRKRRRVPHTSLAIWRLSHINDLPQKFMEPLIPCTLMDPGDLRRGSKEFDQAETVEVSDKQVMAVSPRRVTDCRLTIAPGTPILRPTSTRAFESPKATESDGEGPSLSFQNKTREGLCHSFENARRDFAVDADEETDMDLMDKEMGQNGDSQMLDGWYTRTRTIARWLHKVFETKTKRNKVRTARLSRMLDGKTRKESARVFYEILVLSSREFIAASQEGPYKDIFLQEAPRMEGKLAKC